MSDSTTAHDPSAAQDVVGVFDNNFNQLFMDARPLKASIHRKAKVMSHPVETGSTFTDFRIIEQVEITLHIICKSKGYLNTYNQIEYAFRAASLLNVQTKVGVFQNMLLEAMPHEEDPAHFDTISITLTFKEVQFVIASTSALPATATTKSGGNKTGKTATAGEAGEATEKVQKSSAGYAIGKSYGFF